MNRLLRFPSAPQPIRSAALLLLAALLAGSACGASSGSDDASALTAPTVVAADAIEGAGSDEAAAEQPEQPGAGSEATGSLADLVSELPPAPVGFPQPEPAGPRPVGLGIDALGIAGATVIEVGVEPNGDMEVPPADRVGWYRYGPTPGTDGSAILAAHIAYNGENGVFVRLDDLEAGDEVEVAYEDGTTGRFVVESNQRFDKDELPQDLVFARSGPPRLVLVTCGGQFDSQARSYEDNVVVVARPI